MFRQILRLRETSDTVPLTLWLFWGMKLQCFQSGLKATSHLSLAKNVRIKQHLINLNQRHFSIKQQFLQRLKHLIIRLLASLQSQTTIQNHIYVEILCTSSFFSPCVMRFISDCFVCKTQMAFALCISSSVTQCVSLKGSAERHFKSELWLNFWWSLKGALRYIHATYLDDKKELLCL